MIAAVDNSLCESFTRQNPAYRLARQTFPFLIFKHTVSQRRVCAAIGLPEISLAPVTKKSGSPSKLRVNKAGALEMSSAYSGRLTLDLCTVSHPDQFAR